MWPPGKHSESRPSRTPPPGPGVAYRADDPTRPAGAGDERQLWLASTGRRIALRSLTRLPE
jgi:hypothetical protein